MRSIGCGEAHSVVLTEEGTLWSCGFNEEGQLGRPSLQILVSFESSLAGEIEEVKDLPVIESVSCGASHCAAIDTYGFLWVWGSNS